MQKNNFNASTTSKNTLNFFGLPFDAQDLLAGVSGRHRKEGGAIKKVHSSKCIEKERELLNFQLFWK